MSVATKYEKYISATSASANPKILLCDHKINEKIN